MKFFAAIFFIFYLTIYKRGDAKGLTMITRGCIANYLSQNQLLNVSFKIGPVPKLSLCNNIVRKTVKNVIDGAMKLETKFTEETDVDVTAYKECFSKLIERNNVTDLLLKNFMYHEEKVDNEDELGLITNEVLNLFDYLCYPNKLQNDFNQKFPSSFAGYEKEVNRFCLVSLLREKEVIDQDYDVNFEIADTSSLKCPQYINEDILKVKTEAFDLIHPMSFYQNETIWECAAEKRMAIGYVRAYYRLMAYTFSHENDTRKSDERQKFLDILYSANEAASQCFIIGYESL